MELYRFWIYLIDWHVLKEIISLDNCIGRMCIRINLFLIDIYFIHLFIYLHMLVYWDYN